MLPKGKKIESVKGKTPSVRLRAVIYRYWESQGSPGIFEDTYVAQIEGLIEKYKKLLPKNETHY